MSENDDATTEQDGLSFEVALEQAEEIVRVLEDGSLTLHDSLQKYQTGIGLLGQCFEILEQAELKIAQLARFDDQGRPLTTDFEAPEMGLDEKAQSRGQRRSARLEADSGDPQSPRPKNQDRPNSVDETKGLF